VRPIEADSPFGLSYPIGAIRPRHAAAESIAMRHPALSRPNKKASEITQADPDLRRFRRLPFVAMTLRERGVS
jgi:hypothetical protein